MLYFIIPLIIILAGLTVIFFIVFKKFPKLANIDLENLPEEKILQKKKEIINKRIEANGEVVKEKLAKLAIPIKKMWGKLQLKFRIYAGQVYRLVHHEQNLKKKIAIKRSPPATEDETQKFNNLIAEAEQYLSVNDYDKAEDFFIAAIKIKPRSASAYRGLGDIYFSKNELEQARETYRFVLQIEPDDDSVLVKLANVAESQGDLEEAIQYYQQAVLVNDAFSARFFRLAELLLKVNQPQVAKEAITQAVELEPQNAKYLDLLIEIAIICGEQSLALKTFNDLRLANPNNQKLDNFKDRISKLDASFGLPKR